MIRLWFFFLVYPLYANQLFHSDFELFKSHLILKLSHSVAVDKIDKNLKNGAKIIHPYNTFRPLFSFLNTQEEKFCLIYKIPKDEVSSSGRIDLLQIKKNEFCSFATGKLVSRLNNVKDLVLKFSFNKKSRMSIEFIYENDSRKFFVNFYNLSKKIDVNSFSRYEDSSTKNFIKGTFVLDPDFAPIQNGSYGKKDDSYGEGAVACHLYDENCKVKLPNKCFQCKYGHYGVIYSKCPGKYNKYCGIDKCGELGAPACPRGNLYTGKHLKTSCKGEHSAGFCQKDLKVTCDSLGNLICTD